METLAEKLKKKYESPYQKVAREFDTVLDYVYKIASGERKPTKGKGLRIKKRLEELTNEK